MTVLGLFCLPSISQIQNEEISHGIIFDGEPYIITNPNNSQHLVVAWMSFVPQQSMTIKTTVSFDGGENWSIPKYVPHTNPNFGSADPSLGFDNNGNVYLCYIDFSRVIDSGFVYVRKSLDGGINWGSPIPVISMNSEPGKLAIDRPWMVVDISQTTTDGTIYVTTMNAEGASAPYNPYMMISNDGGSSFTPWRHLDTAGYLSGSIISQPMPTPAVSSSGIFYAIYPSYHLPQSFFARYILASSINGGKTLFYDEVLKSGGGFSDTLAKKGYLLKVNPSNPNHLAFFFLDDPHGDADVYILESFDGGGTWNTAERVNDDPIGNNRMQDLIWADFDNDGDLIVAWRDRRNGYDSTYQTATEIFAAYRAKDSSKFSKNFKLSTMLVNHDTVLNEAGNDFMGIQFVNDTISAVWGDIRTGKLSIWFQRMKVDGTVVGIKNLSSETGRFMMYPNPTGQFLNIEAVSIKEIRILNASGKLMLQRQFNTHFEKVELDIQYLSEGVYFMMLETEDAVYSEKFIKQ